MADTRDDDQDQWRLYRACNGIDPDVFFPHTAADEKHAKSICQGCEVRSECLEFAIAQREDHGIWGGASERERRSIIRRRRRQRAREAHATV